MRTKNISIDIFQQFTASLYQGVYYSVCQLQEPSIEYIRRKAVKLPEREGICCNKIDAHTKFLILDLDETLIHSVETDKEADHILKNGDEPIRLNMRPYCL